MSRLFFSQEICSQLDTDKAKKITGNIMQHAYSSFDILSGFGIYSEEWNKVRMDLRSLKAAAESAYVDVLISTKLHRVEQGPSADKLAVAVTCWINRLHPVHFTEDISDREYDFLNARLAMLAGLAIKVEKEDRLDSVKTFLEDDPRFNDFIYALMWRNPGYKELTLLYQFLFRSCQLIKMEEGVKKVLIVGQEIDDLVELLSSDGFLLESTNENPTAMEILEKDPISVVIVDISRINVADRLVMLSHIKSNHSLEDIPTICMSTLDDGSIIQQCFKNGAVDFISKSAVKSVFLSSLNYL